MSRLFIDASVFISLSAIGRHELLAAIDGEPIVPRAVETELDGDPEATYLEQAVDDGWLSVLDARIRSAAPDGYRRAAAHLERNPDETELDGDIALLTYGLGYTGSTASLETEAEDLVIVTDDKPLRDACKALGISVSGSIGVLVVAVEQSVLEPGDAKDALLAMDEVGTRLSASLVRRAETLIDDAAES